MQRINAWDASKVSKFFQVHVLQISLGKYITALMCQEVDDTLIEPECTLQTIYNTMTRYTIP